MATLKFYLKKPNKQNIFPVMMCYQSKGKKFRFSTKVFTSKGNWLKNRVKAVSLEDYEKNEKLEACEKVINEIEKEGVANNIFYSIETIEKKFREAISKTEPFCITIIQEEPVTKEKVQTEFFKTYDLFIENTKTIKTKSTIYHFETTKKVLLKFEAFQKEPIQFATINTCFYESFRNYLITELKYLNNTVGTQIKNFKAFLNYCMRYELTDIKFNFRDLKKISEDIDIIALTEEELFRLYECKDLSKTQEIAKDYLCFECFTGLRFSDIGGLKNENIKDDFIVMKTIKTKDTLYIPINEFVKEILEKYKGQYENRPLPPSFTNQIVNRYIKEAAKIAKIDELTMVEKFSGSKRITISKPKHEFICTHTGRRTFITLSYEKGMQTEMIMKITGIKIWDTLKKYLKVSEKSKLIKMNEFWSRSTIKQAL